MSGELLHGTTLRPSTRCAVAKYRRHAAGYDATTARTDYIRRRAVAALRLSAGVTVVDVGCGTGLSFPSIEESIGPDGELIGIDCSPDMLAVARRRVAAGGWTNVTLIEGPAEDAVIPSRVDAFLFHFTHDVIRSTTALDHLLARARVGARVAAAGMRYWPRWAGPANIFIRLKARPYVTTMEGFDRPWSLLETRLSDLVVESALYGCCYVASGICQALPRPDDR